MRQVRQTIDLCRVVDKKKTGKIASTNFSRIAQVCGLKLDQSWAGRLGSKAQVNYEEIANDFM
jgi:hypothetical protein